LLQEKLKLIKSQRDFAGMRRYPEPLVDMDFGVGPILRNRGTTDEDIDGFRYRLFFGLHWTLWDWGRIDRHIEEISADTELQDAKVRQLIRSLELEWILIQEKIKVFQKRRAELKHIRSLAEIYAQVAEQEYKTGRSEFRIYFGLWRDQKDLNLYLLNSEKALILLELEVRHLFGGLEAILPIP